MIIVNQIDDYKNRGDYSYPEITTNKNLNDLKLSFIKWFNKQINDYEYQIKNFNEKFLNRTSVEDLDNYYEYSFKTDLILLNDKEFLEYINSVFTIFNKGEFSVYKYVVQFYKLYGDEAECLSENKLPF